MTALTSKQAEALRLDKHLSVTAGAGTGKTRLLVDRYIKLVMRNPQNVRRVLAITFTKKAAGEMQERVTRVVNERLQQSISSDERASLLRIRDQLNSAYISTIHAFCNKILREFPMEAGLAPDFNELDELQSTVLQNQAIDAVFEHLDEQPPDTVMNAFGELFVTLGRRTVRTMLTQALANPYEMQQLQQRFEAWTETEYIEYLESAWIEMIEQHIERPDFDNIADQAALIVNREGDEDKNSKAADILNALRTCQDRLREPQKLQRYDAVLQLSRVLTNKEGEARTPRSLGGKSNWGRDALEHLTSLAEQLSPIARALNKIDPGQPPGDDDRKWYHLFRRFIPLYQTSSEEYRKLKYGQNAVDFEDLQLLTLELLHNRPDIRTQMQQRFAYIMVDEFQDTNALQWSIIRHIAAMDGDKQTVNVFVVGDPKQSIYGFRNADVRVFMEAKQTFAQLAGETQTDHYDGNLVFEESFRFLPVVNHFLNSVFGTIMLQETSNPYAVGYQALVTKRAVKAEGSVELALLDKEDEHYGDETDYIAATIESLISDGTEYFNRDNGEQKELLQYGDIAILIRSRNRLLEVEQALRSRNIPFKTVSGIGYWQKQEIYDWFYLLKFLTNPFDNMALVAVLRSKMFLISDRALFLLEERSGNDYLKKLANLEEQGDFEDSEWQELLRAKELIRKWLDCRNRMNLSELLHMIVEDTRLRAVLAADLNGEQLVANVDKLIERAWWFDNAGLGGLPDFLNMLEEIIDREMREGEASLIMDDKGTVKIMTIHTAKGLQFPVVFVPFLNTKNTGRSNKIYMEADLGMTPTGLFKGEDDKQKTFCLHTLLKYRQYQKEMAEARRIFYVAASRCSDYLYLSAELEQEKVKEESMLAWLLESFQQLGQDLLAEDEASFRNGTLAIRRDYPKKVSTDTTLQNLANLLKTLRSMVGNWKPEKTERPAWMQPLQAPVGDRIFSATQMMTFLEDRSLYYQRYHLGFFENDYDFFASEIHKGDTSRLKGKIIHRLLELISTVDVSRERLIEQILFEYDVLDHQSLDQFREELLQIIERIEHSPTGRRFIKAEEARNEVSVTMRLGDDLFTGTIDRLFKNEEGLWEVVDYKTNSVTKERMPEIARRYSYQVQSYALLLRNLFPAQTSYPVSLYFINPDEVHERRFNRGEIMMISDFFKETITRIKHEFPVQSK